MLSLFLVSVSVGLSNFAGAIGIGLSGVDARTRIRVGIAFGLFEALMPVIGLYIGMSLADRLGHLGQYVGGGLLIATGAYTIYQGRRAVPEERQEGHRRTLRTHHLAITALALSIDNLVVGFALGVERIPIILAATVMAVVSVTMSLIGLELGHRLGARLEAWSEELGGAVLMLVGAALALGFLK